MSQTASSNPERVASELLEDQERVRRALDSLGPALAALREPVSPSIARAAQATENAWRRLEHRFGLHSSSEIAKLLGYEGNRTWANGQRAVGRLLGVRRGSGYRYPGFQVSPEGTLAAVVKDLLHLARERGWSDGSLALWLASPSGSMSDDRPPAEFLHTDPALVLKAAERVMAPAW